MAGKVRRWTECQFTRWYCKCLKRVGAVILPIVGSAYGGAGWPDRYISHRDFKGFVEFKQGEAHLQTSQRVAIKKLLLTGEIVFVGRIANTNMFTLQKMNGVYVSTIDVRPLIGDDAKAGRAFLAQLLEAKKIVLETGIATGNTGGNRADAVCDLARGEEWI